MSDAVDQMRPTAHEEFQRHQREKQGQRVKAGKRRKKITGEECVFTANVVFKAPVLAIIYINR